MLVLVVGVSLVCRSSALIGAATLERKVEPMGDPMKLHPAWEGDLVDLGLGACFGGACGAVFSVALKRLAGALALVASNVAFTAVVIQVAASQGFLTVNKDALRDFASRYVEKLRSLPILRNFREDTKKRRKKAMSFLDAIADGRIEDLASRNEHAVLGVLCGFLIGFLRFF